jgi:hypothetical protein
MQTRTARQLTGARVQTILAKAVIAPSGPTRLAINGRGNDFVRDNGTGVRIFNVLAFRDIKDATSAKTEWLAGLKKEKANDLDGAQEHYKGALNHLMSFSVLKENSAPFMEAYEINCVVEQVPASKELQDAGTKTVLGINQPRAVAVVNTGTSAASIFTDDVAPTATTTTKKGRKATA